MYSLALRIFHHVRHNEIQEAYERCIELAELLKNIINATEEK